MSALSWGLETWKAMSFRHHHFRVGEPLIERTLVPNDMRSFQFIGVAEVGDGTCFSAIHVSQARPFFVFIERVTARASFFEEQFSRFRNSADWGFAAYCAFCSADMRKGRNCCGRPYDRDKNQDPAVGSLIHFFSFCPETSVRTCFLSARVHAATCCFSRSVNAAAWMSA